MGFMKRVSGKEISKSLEDRGWQLSRTKGSHKIYEPPDHLSHLGSVSVPIHGNKTLAEGTQLRIMKAAGIEKTDLQ